ncbi:hypothetical protein ADL01_14975 [Streptomyces sp. NRRL WC-3618]|nr:hypothetical protein ADL01_14975 [Streptomyces sp. NRRL WC-3618]
MQVVKRLPGGHRVALRSVTTVWSVASRAHDRVQDVIRASRSSQVQAKTTERVTFDPPSEGQNSGVAETLTTLDVDELRAQQFRC